MATDLSSVYDALRQADAAGDTAGAQRLAAYIKSQGAPRSYDLVNGQMVSTGSPEAKVAQSPVSSSGIENFRAGWGKGVVDLARGAGQMVGAVSRQDVADSRARDAALMNTGAGKWGDIAGTGVTMLPTAAIPGSGTLAGAAAIGAGTGLLQPSTSTGETLRNTALGGAIAPASILAGRAVGSLAQGAKAAIKPFLKGGAEEIAGQTLQSFAGGSKAAQAAAQELQRAPATLPGVQPSMGELTQNAGLAQLERTLRNNPETLASMAAQDQTNRAAMTGAIEQMAGTPGQRAVNVGLRRDFTAPLYEQAGNTSVEVDNALNKILARPSMEKAWTRAEQLAAENDDKLVRPQMTAAMGRPIPIPNAPPIIDGKALQYLKMGLQDIADTGPQQGIGSHEVASIRNTLSDLNGWIGNKVPALRQADASYAWASRPINQADIAGQLREKLVPALGDFSAVPRLNANSFANAVRNGDQIAADVTGRSGATLAGTLSPQQAGTIRQIGEQLARRANAADLGRAAGSNTAQNLAGQNVLRQLLGPLGLPDSTLGRAAQSVLGKTVMKPYGWVANAAEPDVLQKLAQASLDPKYAAQLLQKAPTSKAAQMIWARQGLLGPLGTTAGLGILGTGNAQK
jgi:hypothetical protein